MDCFVFVSVSLYVYDDVCTCVRLYVCVSVCVFIYIIGECVLGNVFYTVVLRA